MWELYTGAIAYKGAQQAGGSGARRDGSRHRGTTRSLLRCRLADGCVHLSLPAPLMTHPLDMGTSDHAGLQSSAKAVSQAVLSGSRPQFPPGSHPGYAALAASCWAPEPAARPAFWEVVARLEALAAY